MNKQDNDKKLMVVPTYKNGTQQSVDVKKKASIGSTPLLRLQANPGRSVSEYLMFRCVRSVAPRSVCRITYNGDHLCGPAIPFCVDLQRVGRGLVSMLTTRERTLPFR